MPDDRVVDDRNQGQPVDPRPGLPQRVDELGHAVLVAECPSNHVTDGGLLVDSLGSDVHLGHPASVGSGLPDGVGPDDRLVDAVAAGVLGLQP